ncbi:MAG: hypothetical protein IKM48_08645 [Clostridia bacterium]|nr:hypothetical protein [Clostridia bacterium]
MGTSYNAQIDNEKERYSIQFETGNYKYFKMVEKACRKAIDKKKKDKAIMKSAAVRLGRWVI